MLKKLFLLLVITAFIFGGAYSFASETAYEYGFYEITNKKIVSQDNEKVVINFEITNKTDNYYPELFAVPTLKVNGGENLDMFYIAYHKFDATEFSLEPKEKKYISINCKLPDKLPQKNFMISLQIHAVTHRVSLGNESFYLNKINPDFNGFIESSIFAYWKLSDGTYVRSGTGPNVELLALPQISLNLKSTFDKEKKVYPQYTIYERSAIYNSKPVYTDIGEGIIFEPGEEKTILLGVPGFAKPESYLINVNFIDESGAAVSYVYDYRYVIKGASAKVSRIALDSSNVVKGYIYGPADASDLNNVLVEMFAYDENDMLFATTKETVTLTKDATVVSMPLNNTSSSDVTVEVKVSLNGKELNKKVENLTLNIQKEKEKVFTDIDGKDCESAVQILNGLGIINGYPDNTYKPENLVTRAEFSTIATKLMEIELDNQELNVFSDIENHWAKSYINVIYKKGLVSGYPDGTFKPQNNVTYAETLTILLNALGYKSEVSNRKEGWPYNYINKALEIGIGRDMEILDYMLPANRGDIALLTLKAYLLK